MKMSKSRVQFSIEGDLRDSFNEKNWTEAYNNNDVSFKLKYGIKLVSGGFRKERRWVELLILTEKPPFFGQEIQN